MFFDRVPQADPDPIFGLLDAYRADVRKEKINLMVGIYKDDDLQAELLSSVQRGRSRIFDRDAMADYLPIDGLKDLPEQLGPLVFGPKQWIESRGRIYGAHTTGGTGALRAGAEFLAQEVSRFFFLSNHTWPNHRLILEKAGCTIDSYPYYDREKKGFDCEAMLQFLSLLPEKGIVLLHPCCHNPTGSDPSGDQWKEISSLIKKRGLFPFFDFAYQGLGDGIEKDREAVEIFLQDGHELAIAYSCSKNFSMYCQRVGCLFIVARNGDQKEKAGSQVKRIIRALYSNPPAHGARIVSEVLQDNQLRLIWEKDLEAVRSRIKSTRKALIQRLADQAKEIDFTYLQTHKGMFSFIDLNQSQVRKIRERFGIYMTDNGRISICGLSSKNIDYVVNSLVSVCAGQ